MRWGPNCKPLDSAQPHHRLHWCRQAAVGAARSVIAWKRTFAEGRAQWQSMGVKSEQVFRSTDDPNEGLVLFEVDDVEHGRRTLQSAEAQQMRERAGVTEIRVYLPEA